MLLNAGAEDEGRRVTCLSILVSAVCRGNMGGGRSYTTPDGRWCLVGGGGGGWWWVVGGGSLAQLVRS